MTPEVTDPTAGVMFDDDSNASSNQLLDKATNPFGGDSSERPTAEPDNGSLGLLLGFLALIMAIGFLRSWWIPGIVAGLLFMLFMHELGHYVTAKISGMKVTEFFLGFGPKIWSFNRGETEFGIKGIPAGAYVRIMGMTNLDDIDPAEEHRTYRSQPYWQRMMTICAGSAVHFMMAIVALTVLFGAYGYQGFNGTPWEVSQVVANSTASNLGVELGDRIVEFDGAEITTWDDFGDVVTTTAVGPVEVVVERDGDRIELLGELGARSGDVVAGFGLIVNEDRASQGWTVEHVLADSSAQDFGFADQDVIMLAGDIARPTQQQLGRLLTDFENDELAFSVLRGQDTQAVSGNVTLDRTIEFRGFFGIGPEWPDQPDVSWASAPGRAVSDFGTIASTNVRSLLNLINPLQLFDLFSDEPQVANRGPGPSSAPTIEAEDGGNRPVSVIGIGRLIAESETTDQVLFLFVMVNVFVGIFNLMPVLPVDGGHAAIATYERARGLVTGTEHRVDAEKFIPVTWIVVMLLVGFGVWAAVLDIFSWPA